MKAAVERNNVQQESLSAWSTKVDTMGDAVERIMRSAKISDSMMSLTKWRGTQNKELKVLNRQFHRVRGPWQLCCWHVSVGTCLCQGHDKIPETVLTKRQACKISTTCWQDLRTPRKQILNTLN